jgi:hypothetical protein
MNSKLRARALQIPEIMGVHVPYAPPAPAIQESLDAMGQSAVMMDDMVTYSAVLVK